MAEQRKVVTQSPENSETPLADVAKDLPAQLTLAHLADVSDSDAVGASAFFTLIVGLVLNFQVPCAVSPIVACVPP